jgi:3,4-dihydroxy 2-butanone 4-phosphate synthase/GTP cyclohydrolase II
MSKLKQLRISPNQIKTVHQHGRYELIGPVNLPIKLLTGKLSNFNAWYFGFPGGRYAALVKGNPRAQKRPLVRFESVCIWSHLFNSQYCDCDWQLDEAKRLIDAEGHGIVIFAFDHHGKAVGLRNHFIVYAEGQRRGHELVVDAYRSLGFNEDYRTDYSDAADILKHFGVTRIRLLSNNPQRIKLIKQAGIDVKRVAHEMKLNENNRSELIAKKQKLGHPLTLRESQ